MIETCVHINYVPYHIKYDINNFNNVIDELLINNNLNKNDVKFFVFDKYYNYSEITSENCAYTNVRVIIKKN